MSRFDACIKQKLLDTCLSMSDGQAQSAVLTTHYSTYPSIDCFFRAVRVGSSTGLLARIRYDFPEAVPTQLEDVFRYTEVLNAQLQHSQVFVVDDLDGDRGYYLRMDTILRKTYSRSSISHFLDDITADLDILLRYFRPPAFGADSAASRIIAPPMYTGLRHCS